MINLAIFASGNGSNAENLIHYFQASEKIAVIAIFCNNPNAGVLKRAERLNTPAIVFSKEDINGSEVLNKLATLKVDAIVLAGFLWKIPDRLVRHYENRIINIHPSLLPKYGGKGMYGSHVHRAVLRSGDTESGVTIHLVNQEFDRGRILYQARCPVREGDTPDSLAERIHKLEYKHFPEVVKDYLYETL
jgi:phosphoribosylglycinamide formyltransferase-1